MTQGLKNRRKWERRRLRKAKWIAFWKDVAIAFALGTGGTMAVLIWLMFGGR